MFLISFMTNSLKAIGFNVRADLHGGLSSSMEIAQFADYAFGVATDRTGHSLSPTAVISLLNVFIAALSYRVPGQAMESLR